MTVQGVIAALAGMRERPDREALLHFGPYKVLIICGKRDDRLPMEMMESQLAAPNVVDRLITENGHMGHIEDTEVCIETLAHFLHETL
jgi:pimeloyl-ACP methyl ester carboxylesterase